MQPQLCAGQDTGRDVWCSTDWMVARLIRLGWVQKLDKANIPNAANLEDSLADVEFDPGRKLLAALAERLHRHRLQPRRHRRQEGRERSTSCSPTRRSRAGSRCSPRCATPSAW